MVLVWQCGGGTGEPRSEFSRFLECPDLGNFFYAQLKLLVPRKVSEDDKLIEYDALL